ncbi:MAG: 6-phosphofructokinase 2 [Methanomethylovorans sp. PtaU1.Bin093]|uniref:1-phosphofructokinase family hexose kinase n=1 Tax=Methanomethylovorans sp. PtaU1.Bin093 TaxID=1811679 RepID=UPI0009D43EBF|nr:1-phosphofructokinase family hexose kinase [Methanomethylovorans sp. PtaU1.Bin093]OPY22314.1 MAG: 6-phosphofructokinase 2 [Methanomethylovorans sp. PtaU1.Bin093]
MRTIITLNMNPAIDKSTTTEHVIAERKLYCGPASYEPGGGGVNVSRAIKKLGGGSLLVYPAGGMPGKMLNELLEQEGIDQLLLPIKGFTRENLIVLEGTTGRQFRFGMQGPKLERDEWEHCLLELSNANPAPDYLVASGSLPLGVPSDFYARVARIGKKMGAKVIIDTAGDALAHALQEGVYLIKPNVREFRELAGNDIKEESQIIEAAQSMVRAGQCEVMVISLGAAGALLVSENIVEHIVPPTVPISSKVGAGDSMVAGIVLSLSRGKELREAALYGIAAGSAAVMTPGTELCRKEDTERLYAKMISSN